MIHAMMATWGFDEAKRRAALERRCPKCHSKQIAPEKKINKPVSCKKCGMQIPAKKKSE